MNRFSLLLATALLLSPAASRAAAPLLLNYQGHLVDKGTGAPKTGTFPMTFAFYDSESGNQQLPSGSPWTEPQNVSVSNGEFSVLLGSVVPLPADPFAGATTDSHGPVVFLQVSVNNEPLLPRSRIASAAFSLRGQEIGARATLANGGVSIPNNIFTTVTWNGQDRWDEGGVHASGTAALIAPRKGKYMISASINWANAGGTYTKYVDLRLNGTRTLAGQGQVVGAFGGDQQSVSTIEQLDAGDSITCVVFQNSGGDLNIKGRDGTTAFGPTTANTSSEFVMMEIP